MYIYPIDLSEFHKKYLVTVQPDEKLNDIIDKFLNEAKMDIKKHSGKMFSNILEAFFSELEDIEMTYEKYYVREYEDVEEYMYKKMLMEKSEIEHIFSKVKEEEKIYFSDLDYKLDSNYENLFEYEEENLLIKINNILEMI